MKQEDHILRSWQQNANAWNKAISDEAIESRKLVTNRAIIDAVISLDPKRILDIGCGEGWLCRRLKEHGIETTGVDAIQALVDSARKQDDGDYFVYSYQELIAGKYSSPQKFDALVFNFSLFGNELVKNLLESLHRYINDGGLLIIQTLHPVSANGDHVYEDGWREGTWTGFSKEFTNPAPWYFRTIESWKKLFSETGFSLIQMIEPIHPHTNKPASIIFICGPE